MVGPESPTPKGGGLFLFLLRTALKDRIGAHARVRGRIIYSNHLGFITLLCLGSWVDLPGLAAASSKQQQEARAKWANPELCRGGWESAEILVDDTYGYEGPSNKVRSRTSTVAAGNGRRKGRTEASKTVKNSQKKCPLLGSLGAKDLLGGGHFHWNHPR